MRGKYPWAACLLYTSYWEACALTGIEPATSWYMGGCPVHWATSARPEIILKHILYFSDLLQTLMASHHAWSQIHNLYLSWPRMPYLIWKLAFCCHFSRFKISFPELSEGPLAPFVPSDLHYASALVWCFTFHTEIHNHKNPLERYLNLFKDVWEGWCGWILVSKGEGGTHVPDATELLQITVRCKTSFQVRKESLEPFRAEGESWSDLHNYTFILDALEEWKRRQTWEQGSASSAVREGSPASSHGALAVLMWEGAVS